MEYAQITMDEYLGLKKEIHESIVHIARSFVRIGKTLYQIDQAGAYRMDGYHNLAEFALAEYGIKASGVSRFVGVYKKYCDGGELKEQYEGYTYAQLVEMLNLSQEDEALIRPDTPREDIRELKRFNKEGEHDVHGLEHWKEQDSEDAEMKTILEEVLLLLFKKKDRESDFNEVCKRIKAGRKHERAFAELVNPSGNRTIRNGRTMTFLFENEVRIKVWGRESPEICSYARLMKLFEEVFRDTLRENENWWKRQFEPGEIMEKKIAPAQKTEIVSREKEPEEPKKEKLPEDQRDTNESVREKQIPGQDTILNHPELLPEEYKTAAQVDGEQVPAEVEPTEAQRKDECLSLISSIQGNVTLEKYKEAYQAAGQLLQNLEVMK